MIPGLRHHLQAIEQIVYIYISYAHLIVVKFQKKEARNSKELKTNKNGELSKGSSSEGNTKRGSKSRSRGLIKRAKLPGNTL